jgi:hypothetical protein
MDSQEQVIRFFRQRKVTELEPLQQALGGRSRRTVFRDLAQLGYLSSYTHAGRYYTLRDLPRFDAQGLWFHEDIGFSRAGTLKETVALLVDQAPDGRTHDELQHLLRVRVHNTLLDLFRQRRIGREALQRVYLYVSADPTRAAAQLAERRELAAVLAEVLRVATDEEVVEVLVEALRAIPEVPTPALVAQRLVARGVRLEPHHVEQVYEEHGLVPGKKTAPPSSRPSRR